MASGPQGASVPALGLSNKPVYDVEAQKEKVENKSQSDLYAENLFSPTYLTGNFPFLHFSIYTRTTH